MRKFTYTDVNNWKVVNNEGQTLTVKEGEKVKTLTGFNGYRQALTASKKHGGNPVRE
jgi:hypothetical protein